MIRYFFLLLFCTTCFLGLNAQTDSLATQKDSIFIPDTSRFHSDFRKKFSLRWHQYPHSPTKATLLSTFIPGTGQMYNGHKKEGSLFRKYWKVPIVYGGIATCVAFIDFNTKKYRFYRKEYIAAADSDPNTSPTIQTTASQLDKIQDQYHRWMDVSYMALAGVYLLQVIDANVDAHLFYYDISPELSLQFHPSVVYTGQVKPALGMTLKF